MPYCPKCGSEVGEADRFCSGCGAPLREEKGVLVTEELDIPFPEANDPLLEISIAVAGNIAAGPGDEKLLEGTISYDVPEWKPEITQTENRVAVKQRSSVTWQAFESPINDWEIKMGKAKPFRLRVKTGVMRGEWDLGGIPLTGLDVETGVSQNKLGFSEPNPETLNTVSIQTGVGETRLTGLLNARFREMRVGGGVGEVKLDFTGAELEEDANVRVEGGVGGFHITVDKETRALFKVSGLTHVNALGRIYKVRGGLGRSEYANEAYDDLEGPILEFNITLGLGGITLRAT
jgi:hypothetical protein